MPEATEKLPEEGKKKTFLKKQPKNPMYVSLLYFKISPAVLRDLSQILYLELVNLESWMLLKPAGNLR